MANAGRPKKETAQDINLYSEEIEETASDLPSKIKDINLSLTKLKTILRNYKNLSDCITLVSDEKEVPAVLATLKSIYYSARGMNIPEQELVPLYMHEIVIINSK